MMYLTVLIASLALFFGFFALTMVEAKTGVRVLAGSRKKLDSQVGKLVFIFENVEWGTFFTHLVQSIAARVAHDIAHVSLRIVRFVERQLTRVVRYMRDRRPNVLAPTPSRRPLLTQTIDYVRKTIRRSHSNKDSR